VACTKEAFEFRLWGWWASLAKDPSLHLEADSRGYDTWLMPGGLIGLQAWTDGGNSTLGRDPRRTQDCSDAATCTSVTRSIEALGSQFLPELALRADGLLVMAGTTCAQDLKVTDNAVQKTPGGAQDGFLVVLRLW